MKEAVIVAADMNRTAKFVEVEHSDFCDGEHDDITGACIPFNQDM